MLTLLILTELPYSQGQTDKTTLPHILPIHQKHSNESKTEFVLCEFLGRGSQSLRLRVRPHVPTPEGPQTSHFPSLVLALTKKEELGGFFFKSPALIFPHST